MQLKTQVSTSLEIPLTSLLLQSLSTSLFIVYGPKRVYIFRIFLSSQAHFSDLKGAGWSSGCSLSTVFLTEESFKETQLVHQEVSQGLLQTAGTINNFLGTKNISTSFHMCHGLHKQSFEELKVTQITIRDNTSFRRSYLLDIFSLKVVKAKVTQK